VAAAGAGTFRRLAAATYDGLALLAVLMLVIALLQVSTGGEAITRARVGAPLEYLVRTLLALIVFGYFAHGWTRRGQTLGMKAWGIRLERCDGALPRVADVALRLLCAAPLYLLAIAGFGLLIARHGSWLVVAACCVPLAVSFGWNVASGRALHDLLSRTRIVRLPPGG